MTISDHDVRTALLRATDHLAAPPSLLDDVRRGGRRRLWRRRAVLASGLAVVAATSASAVLRPRDGESAEPLDPSSPLFSHPTRGDLAGDERYLREVRRQWAGLDDPLPNMRGNPHVWWAGKTPAGPAAFVAQRGGTGAAVGWVEPTAGGPRVSNVTSVNHPTDFDEVPQAILLGPDRDVLLVLDFGWPVEFSGSYRYAGDGTVVRTYEPFAFRDGAGWRLVGRQAGGITVALRARSGPVGISNAGPVLDALTRGAVPERLEYVLPGGDRVWGSVVTAAVQFSDALRQYQDLDGSHYLDPRQPNLTVYGRTPDGRHLVLQTVQLDDDPARAVALVSRDQVEYEVLATQVVDWEAALPVSLRLPAGMGRLVVAPEAALAYRVAGDARWHDARRDAALLPAKAVTVRVTPRTGPAVDVPLR